MEKEIKLIAVYARVSTSQQEDEGTVETQLLAVREFAQKNNYTIVQEYIDDGWSGDMIVRPHLDQLRIDAKRKVWQAVLIYDPDRLARRYSYQELIMDELREAGAEVIFVTTPAPKNSEDKILYGVKGLFAEYERAKISERFRLGKLRKVKEGHLLVSEPAYGYDYVLKQEGVHGYYKINEEEAKVVKMLFDWIANQHFTLRQVVRKLQELKIKPRRSKREVWSTSTLSTLLRNKVYIGSAHWGSSYAVVPVNPINKEKYRKMKKSSRKMRPVEDWFAIPTPPIISEELFEKAGAQLKSNFALCQRNKKNEYLLAGKILCQCGKTRAGEGPQHGKHLYYRCTDRVRSFPLPPSCNEKGINARIADKLVWQKIAKLMSSPELLLKQVDRWMGAKKLKVKSSFGDIASLEKEIAKLKDQEDRYNKAYGAGLFTIEQLKEYTVPARERIKAIELDIAKAKQEANQTNVDAIPDKLEVSTFAQKAVQMLSSLNFEAKRAIVMNTVDKIIGTQAQLQVYGYIPITNHVKLFTNDRNRRTPKRGEVHAF